MRLHPAESRIRKLSAETPATLILHVSGDRFRHGTKLLRWRSDKAPRQCTFEQLQREAQPSRLIKTLLNASAGTVRSKH